MCYVTVPPRWRVPNLEFRGKHGEERHSYSECIGLSMDLNTTKVLRSAIIPTLFGVKERTELEEI